MSSEVLEGLCNVSVRWAYMVFRRSSPSIAVLRRRSEGASASRDLMPSKQHYLPAAFIGGFGHRLTGKSRRAARIVAWDSETGTVGDPIKAERIGWLHDTYTIPELGVALEDVVDSVWDAYEGVLPDAAQAVSRGQLSTST